MTLKKNILAIALLAAAAGAHAQSTPAAPASASAPAAVISPAKRDLLQRLITLQQPALEGMARNLAEQPALQMLSAARQAMPGVPEAKREAVVAKIDGEARKYFEEANAVIKERAGKVGQAALLPLFDEKFSEDELRQLLVALEAPAYKKFQLLAPDMGNAFGQKVVADLRPVLDPKLKALEQTITSTLGVTPAADGQSGAKPAKTPASGAKAKK